MGCLGGDSGREIFFGYIYTEQSGEVRVDQFASGEKLPL